MVRGRGAARWLVRVLVSAGIIGYVLADVDLGDLAHALAHLRLAPVLVGLGLFLFSQALSAYKWSWIGRALGFERSVVDYGRFYFIGMFFNLFGPSTLGGDLVRALYLGAGGRRLLATAAIVSVVLHLTQVAGQYVLARAAGARLPFSYCLIFYPVISVMTSLPVSVNGVGVREGGYLYFLTRIDIDDSIAVTLGLSWVAETFLACLAAGVLFLASEAVLALL